jgi:hypothetical protein
LAAKTLTAQQIDDEICAIDSDQTKMFDVDAFRSISLRDAAIRRLMRIKGVRRRLCSCVG